MACDGLRCVYEAAGDFALASQPWLIETMRFGVSVIDQSTATLGSAREGDLFPANS